MIRLALILLFLGGPALATQDGWPALHDVTGVAADDVLNVRATPSARAEIIGSLAPDATDIEVIRPDEHLNWGLVNLGERSGWVSLRYLARHPGQFDTYFPEFTTCTGTEPFWSLTREDGTLALDTAFGDTPPLTEDILFEIGTISHRHRYSLATDSMVGVISRQACTDNMSGRAYGLEINLVLPGEERHLQGCCTVRPLSASR